jgi:hypothetical protein
MLIKQKVSMSQSRVLKTYNSNMRGVDHRDCLVGKHANDVRGKKWHWTLFTHIIYMTIANIWLLYKRTYELHLLSFKRAVTFVYLKIDTNRSS